MAAVNDIPIKAILPYLGGKRRMAARIVDLMLARGVKQYVEPYHGSLAVLLELRCRGFQGPAIANDWNRWVANLAMVLSHKTAGDALCKCLEMLPFDESIYQYALASLATAHPIDLLDYGDDNVKRATSIAAAYMVASWMGPNGEAGADREWDELRNRFCVRWTTSGGDPAKRWASVVESMPGWRELLRSKTTFTRRDALDVIGHVPDAPGVCIYVDSPYLEETRSGLRYAEDVEDGTGTLRESDDHHARLAALLNKFEAATIIVSHYAHERLQRLYPIDQWEHVDCAQNKATAQAHEGAQKKNSPEVLIVRRARP